MTKYWILPLLLCFGLSYTQEQSNLILQSREESWLSLSVNKKTGYFSLLNLQEKDNNFSSFLFGGPLPSSRIGFLVDGKETRFSSLENFVPLGIGAGYQIDGIFKDKEGLHIEQAYFLMSTDTNNLLKTLGLAILVSNSSPDKVRKVGVKILLDTEISENYGKSLLHLPSLKRIEKPVHFYSESIPEYIFVGQEDLEIGINEEKGFRVYPYLSTNFPSNIVVANWRRLTESAWIPSDLGTNFVYSAGGALDVGLGIYFGEVSLRPGQEITLGAALSLDSITTVPVLKDNRNIRSILGEEALRLGVFSPERYFINELLVNPQNPMVQDLLSQKVLPKIVPGRGFSSSKKENQELLEFEKKEDELVNSILSQQSPLDLKLLFMNSTMHELRKRYEQERGYRPSVPKPEHPPAQGIKERYYAQ